MDFQATSRSFARFSLVAGAALLALAGTAQAAAGDIVVRGRVLQLDPANESSPIAALGVAPDQISANSKLIWEVDATYFITNNVAAELIATNPQQHTVYLSGIRLGTIKHLPPTLTFQYHFAPTNPSVRPYAGLGLNYTIFSGVKLDAGSVLPSSTPLSIKKSSWGLAYNFGADFPINDKLSINVDFKKIDISTKVSLKADGTYLSTAKINPVLFGAGVGYKF